ncbi:MAG: ScyD/ScyE family protein [Anaerolineae bacterium]|jgi:sugar lactone lactonase YvrE|nr:ScyD/ScyE family protein [Anaerolineae bacterium]
MIKKWVGVLILISMIGSSLLFAQLSPEPIVSGLSYPRGIEYDADGNLYIAESGAGGDQVISEIEGLQIKGGSTGQIIKVAPDGTQTVLWGNFFSLFVPFEGASLGIYRVIPDGDSLWLVLSEQQNASVFSDAIVQIDTATGRVRTYIDLYAYEAANDLDGTGEIYSNPSDVEIAPDGRVFIADAGANAVLTWTAEGGLQTFQAWEGNPVPTGIEFASNGEVLISFLGQGLTPGAGRIERWSADGRELLWTYEGLTSVTDLLVDANDHIYIVQIAELGEQGPAPASGLVARVTEDEVIVIAEGLNTPFGLAMTPGGDLVVSTHSAFSEPEIGEILLIALDE